MQGAFFLAIIHRKVPAIMHRVPTIHCPPNGYAKAYSGVSLDSFVKRVTYQYINRKGIENIGHTVETMAAAEGLDAHKNAVAIRLGRGN